MSTGTGKISEHVAAVIERRVLQDFQDTRRRPLVLGICGAQGSGKSTLASALCDRFNAEGVETVTLSIDDIYKTKAEREELARTVHPLFRTRGVPGTHDVGLALSVLDALERGESARLPRFDKSTDDRASVDQWPEARGSTQLVIFEGWFVGARPGSSLSSTPLNALEREQDPEGIWRRHVKRSLEGDYQKLFSRIDLLVLLAAPSFDVVARWRTEQEQPLRKHGTGMSDEEILRFIQHYERLTREILLTMPDYADVVISLGDDRSCKSIVQRGRHSPPAQPSSSINWG